MRRQRLTVQLVKEMSASHGTAARTRVVADNQRTVCDGNCGRGRACEDDFFFQQICDEIEGTFKDMIVQ
jgi:hypothetical protein